MGAQKERQGLAMELNINEETVNVELSKPNQSQLFELDKFYRKVFSECLREGILTEAEAKKRYEETGAWGSADDKKVANLIELIAFNSVLLSEEDEMTDDAAELVTKLQRDRAEMIEMLGRKTELFSNTAEAMANEQKVYKYVALCLVGEDRKPVFGSESELENFALNQEEDFGSLISEAYAQVYGVETSGDIITQNWAEVDFLRMIAEQEEASDEEEKTEE